MFRDWFQEYILYVDENIWQRAGIHTKYLAKDSDDIWEPGDHEKPGERENTRVTEQELREQLDLLIKKHLSFIEEHKNVGFYSTKEAIDIVLKYVNIIEEVSKQLQVPKAMIQAVLFKEIRMKDFRDQLADSFVMEYYRYSRAVEDFGSKSDMDRFVSGAPYPNLPMRQDSSTGLGQIFTETAINAYNAAIMRGDINGSKKRYDNLHQREAIWNELRDDETNIYYIGLVLLLKATGGLLFASDEEIEATLAAYNGTNHAAKEYGREVFQYYQLFERFAS